MRRLTVLTFVAIFAMALIGCENSTNTAVVNKTNGNVAPNANVAVVVNNNSPMANNMNAMTSGSNRYDANITRAEYDKDKDRYSQEAKSAGSTIGSGLNDGYLWTKTKGALATTNDLRDSTINVDINNAVVTLRGTVATEAEKKKAGEVAKVDGVTSVKNDLKVQAGDSMGNQMTSGNTNMSNANMKK